MPPRGIDIPRDKLAAFCRKWNVRELALFGSVVRDDFRPDSDVDVLVTFPEESGVSLYDWVDMIEELKTIFGREVDLVDKTAIRNPFRRRRILGEAEVIYAA